MTAAKAKRTVIGVEGECGDCLPVYQHMDGTREVGWPGTWGHSITPPEGRIVPYPHECVNAGRQPS